MTNIAKRVTDAERVARYGALNLSEKERVELLAYDKMVEAGEKTEFDLSPEQNQIAMKYTKTGTRKTPTVYQFAPKKRKPNATKGGIIAELVGFFEKNSQFSAENVQILNKERQISFMVGEETFELTLVQKRKPKK